MVTYKELYFHLFNALTDALEAPTFDAAKEILQTAQQEAEEMYINHGPNVLKFEYRS